MQKIDIKDIKTGDCMLESANSWLAREIQNFQCIDNKDGGKFNHAAIFWWAYDELMVIEADKRGIAITPFKQYMEEKVYKAIIVLRPTFEVDGIEYGKFMLPYAGHTKYDFFNLLIAQPIKMLTKWWVGERTQSTKKFICGEWAHYVYKHFRPDLFVEESQRIAPVDIFENLLFTHYQIKP